jgi:hypothetical protein
MSQLEGASYRVRFPGSYLADAGIAPAELRAVLEARIQQLLQREHVIVRRQSEGQTREFDALSSIVSLEAGDEEAPAVLDAHLRFTVRAQVRPDEVVALLIPDTDPRTVDIERTMLWKDGSGRRLDPITLLSVRD